MAFLRSLLIKNLPKKLYLHKLLDFEITYDLALKTEVILNIIIPDMFCNVMIIRCYVFRKS